MIAQLVKYLVHMCEGLSANPSSHVKPATAMLFHSTGSRDPRQADPQSLLISQYGCRFIERPCFRIKMEND